MRHRTNTLVQGTWFKLGKLTNPETQRVSYFIQVDPYTMGWYKQVGNGFGSEEFTIELDKVRDHFDPGHNRGGRWATKWKYKSRETAEQLLTIAILKFGV